MTKSEVIKKIARLAGIPETEAKRFFEILLDKLYFHLKNNNIVTIEEIGEFRLGKFDRIGHKEESFENKFIFLLPTIQKENFHQKNEKESVQPLVFNIPQGMQVEENILDEHFSLSIGKPLIPIGEISSDDFYFYPKTGQSFLKSLENEAVKIIDSKAVILQQSIADDDLVFSETDDWQVVTSKRDNPFFKEYSIDELEDQLADELIEESDENIPWDFGKVEFDEDEISDKLIEDEVTSLKDEKISWDFGNQTDSEDILVEEDPDDSVDEENEADLSEDIETDYNEEEEEEISESEETEKLVESETVTTESLDNENEDIFSHYADSSNESEVDEVITEFEEKELNQQIPYVETDKTDSPDFTEEEIIHYKKYEYQTKKRATNVFWIALFGMLLIPIFIYFVWSNPSLKELVFGAKQEPIIAEETESPVIIERDYTVPVSIPKDDNIVASAEPKEEIKEELTPEVKVDVQPVPTTISAIPVEQGEFVFVKDLIYSRSNQFYVQVSSWQTIYSARTDSANYVRRGFSSHIFTSYISNLKRTQHRVLVGPFENRTKADEFSKTVK